MQNFHRTFCPYFQINRIVDLCGKDIDDAVKRQMDFCAVSWDAETIQQNWKEVYERIKWTEENVIPGTSGATREG